jgi:anti-sigma factor RsiW
VENLLMTKHEDENTDTLERALIQSYRSQPDVSQAVDVTQAVMRDIRRSMGERRRWAPATVLDQFVWRTATITAAVVLMATVLTVGLLRPDSPALLAEELEAVPLFAE